MTNDHTMEDKHEDEASSGAEAIQVIVRLRPPNALEQEDPSNRKVISAHALEKQIRICRSSPAQTSTRGNSSELKEEILNCQYDAVFDEHASQEQLYQYLQPTIEQVAQGFNACVFAYGQTGSGKTYSMLGKNTTTAATVDDDHHHRGMIPRAIEGLFHELQEIQTLGTSASVHCSYMQIYNNEVYDLLQSTQSRGKSLAIRQDLKGHIYASGLSEFRVETTESVMALLQRGTKHRHLRATEYNEQSSRSHAILQLRMEVESCGVTEGTTIIRRAKLNLIDLAGSEKWNVDLAMDHPRAKELTNINQSLSALGNVISALGKHQSHVPYRDAKLTRLLQDSLGGNTRTIVLATCSPMSSARDESLSTLQFADRAKRVIVRIQANEIIDDAVLLARAQREIARLKTKLKQRPLMTHQGPGLETQLSQVTTQLKASQRQNRKLHQRLEKLKAKLKQSKERQDDRANISDDGYQMQETNQLADLQHERQRLESQLARMTEPEEAQDRCPMCRRNIDHHTDAELDVCIAREARAPVEEQVQADNENSCPMCHRVIDHHTDAELDACIEEEARGFSSSREELDPEIQRSTVLPSTLTTTIDTLTKSKPLRPRSVLEPLKTKVRPSIDILHPDDIPLKTRLQISNSSVDIGLEISIYKYRYDCWYECIIVGFDRRRHMHCCQYEYGDKQWHDLRQAKHRVLRQTTDDAITTTNAHDEPESSTTKARPLSNVMIRKRLAILSQVYK